MLLLAMRCMDYYGLYDYILILRTLSSKGYIYLGPSEHLLAPFYCLYVLEESESTTASSVPWLKVLLIIDNVILKTIINYVNIFKSLCIV